MARIKRPDWLVIGGKFKSNDGSEFSVVGYYHSSCVEIEFTETLTRSFVEAGNIKAGRVRDKNKPSIWGWFLRSWWLYREVRSLH